jgi:hypothetical protein
MNDSVLLRHFNRNLYSKTISGKFRRLPDRLAEFGNENRLIKITIADGLAKYRYDSWFKFLKGYCRMKCFAIVIFKGKFFMLFVLLFIMLLGLPTVMQIKKLRNRKSLLIILVLLIMFNHVWQLGKIVQIHDAIE